MVSNMIWARASSSGKNASLKKQRCVILSRIRTELRMIGAAPVTRTAYRSVAGGRLYDVTVIQVAMPQGFPVSTAAIGANPDPL